MKKLFITLVLLLCRIVVFTQSTWSEKFSDAIISRYQPTINAMTGKGWEYSNGIILHGMEKVYLKTNNATYLNYIKAYIDTYVDASGNVTGLGTTVDKIQPGILCLFLYEQTGQLKYKTAATNIKNYLLSTSPVNFQKTAEGGYWHKNDGNYNNVMLIDGMYMLNPFLVKYASLFNDPTLYDVSTFQMILLASKVMPTGSNLPKHAYDYSKTKVWANGTTGVSSEVWSRATGWYMMALVDVLQYLPTTHAKYNTILEIFQRMSVGVAASQNSTTGLWYQVMDKPTTSGNWLESSGSGMFVYALKKGIENGWINSSMYTSICELGWTGMQSKIGTYTDSKPQIKNFCVATGVQNNTAAYIALGNTSSPIASGTQHPHGYCGILMAASSMEFTKVAVTGISLNTISLSINVNEIKQLTASILPSNASNKNINWSSSNSSIAAVSTTGTVTGINAGNSIVTATTQEGNFVASATITVSSIEVTGITLSPNTALLNIGGSVQLVHSVAPTNATNKNVIWTSNNTAIATISSSGLVSAIGTGTATIIVTTQDGAFSASSKITVEQTVVLNCTATGFVTFEKWNNISGTTIPLLKSNVNYPNKPSSTTTLTRMEMPSNAADNYGARISGYLCAPLTGVYTFWIAGDDNAELWLSSNNSPTNIVKIAYHTGWTNSKEWAKFATQKSVQISLVKGNVYYIEALVKEGTGGDNLAVGWLKPGQTGTAPSEVIPGSVLSPRNASGGKVGVEFEFDGENVMNVFPNPAKSSISISMPQQIVNTFSKINVYSMSGINHINLSKTVDSNETIDLNGLSNGIYLLQISNSVYTFSKKFYINR